MEESTLGKGFPGKVWWNFKEPLQLPTNIIEKCEEISMVTALRIYKRYKLTIKPW